MTADYPANTTSESSISREQQIQAFLAQCGLEGCARSPIPGDASFRRYERLREGDSAWIMMDAPPAHEDVRPFMQIQSILAAHGYSPPVIQAAAPEEGLLLLEDLGDYLYSALLRAGEADEAALYEAAIDLLLDLKAKPLPQAAVPPYSHDKMMQEVGLFTDWFVPELPEKVSADALGEWQAIWAALLPKACAVPQTLVLRDYHADNLLWLEEREGTARVGLLDFQDAVIGPVTYDLISLLEDARRDVSPAVARSCFARFYAGFDADEREALECSAAILAAQRNIKIIGIFTRLMRRDGKPRYLGFLPRVWGHVMHDLTSPHLAPLKDWMDHYVPETYRDDPTPWMKGAQ